jgi:hypothetical protein
MTQKYEPRLLLNIIGSVLKEEIRWGSITDFYGNYEIFPKWQIDLQIQVLFIREMVGKILNSINILGEKML